MGYDRRGLSRKHWIIILTAILMGGFFLYSVTMFLLNTFMLPADLMGQPNQIELINQRLDIRLLAEKVLGACMTIASVGSCFVIYDFIKVGPAASFKKIFTLFGAMAAGLLACGGIFTLIDQSGYGDYLFIVYTICLGLIVEFAVVLFFNLIKQIRLKKRYARPRDII